MTVDNTEPLVIVIDGYKVEPMNLKGIESLKAI